MKDSIIPWRSNYNTIEVCHEDVPQLMDLIFHENIANAFNNDDTHVAPGIPSNHIGNTAIKYDRTSAVKALNEGHTIQIFNWDINISKFVDQARPNDIPRFIINMPDGMPGVIASEVYELLKSNNIGLTFHL